MRLALKNLVSAEETFQRLRDERRNAELQAPAVIAAAQKELEEAETAYGETLALARVGEQVDVDGARARVTRAREAVIDAEHAVQSAARAVKIYEQNVLPKIAESAIREQAEQIKARYQVLTPRLKKALLELKTVNDEIAHLDAMVRADFDGNHPCIRAVQGLPCSALERFR
jgi:hypothetical protein